MKKHKRVYAAIDLDSIMQNFENMKKLMRRESKIIAVIKADGYGHGAAPIAHMMEHCDYIWGFAVATVEEAVSLRGQKIRKPILILGYTFAEDYETLVRADIRPVVFKMDMAKELSDAASRLKRTLTVHLAVDTGMMRIGFSDTLQSIDEIKEIAGLPGLKTEGLYTHFARADEADKSNALEQLRRFRKFENLLEKAGISIPIKHCSNSAGILELPQANLDMVRAGISIYGIYPSQEMSRDAVTLYPAMSLKSHIIYIKDVEAGIPISYGGTYTTTVKTRVATIPVGYGDGYPRSLSNKGWVIIHGKKAPVLGRVCMDQFMVDVTEIPEAKELDEVILMGKDGDEILNVDILSALSGRFPYEFVCDIGKRVPRIYYQNGKQIMDAPSGHFGCPETVDVNMDAPSGHFGCPEIREKNMVNE